MSAKDLNLKIVEIRKNGVVTASDSLEIINKKIPELENSISEYERKLNDVVESQEKIEASLKVFKSKRNKDFVDKMTIEALENDSSSRELIDSYESQLKDFKRTKSIMESMISEYQVNPDQILSTTFSTKYSVYSHDEKLNRTLSTIAYSNRENDAIILHLLNN